MRNTLTGYVSSDGVSWSVIGSQTLSIGSRLYVGLAVLSFDNTTVTSATFDNVNVSHFDGELSVGSVTSSSYQPPNEPGNTIDNNLDTRWSAEGDGQWIQYDLTAVQTIDGVSIAWTNGDLRIATFDVQVSMDGQIWTMVFNGTSSGATLNQQASYFMPVTGRYARIVGHGSSWNYWNSIAEVRILGTKPTAYAIGTVTASSYENPNLPTNSVDNDLNTRWSAQGDGQWVQYDLGSVTKVGFIAIAWYLGDQRTNIFDVQLSNDGFTWTPVLTGATSNGTTLAQQMYTVVTTNGRFVRIVGHGNSWSDWNSITEVDIYH